MEARELTVSRRGRGLGVERGEERAGATEVWGAGGMDGLGSMAF